MEREDAEPSAEQREWERAADRVRRRLTEAADLIPAMKPDEMKQFVEAMREAFWLSQYAATFDKKVEVEMTKHAFQD